MNCTIITALAEALPQSEDRCKLALHKPAVSALSPTNFSLRPTERVVNNLWDWDGHRDDKHVELVPQAPLTKPL